jgi:hypothetical protein
MICKKIKPINSTGEAPFFDLYESRQYDRRAAGLVVRRAGSLTIGGRRHQVRKGDIFLIPSTRDLQGSRPLDAFLIGSMSLLILLFLVLFLSL